MAEHAQHGSLLRHDLLAKGGAPPVEEGAEERVLQMLGDDGKGPQMAAGDLAEPLEIPRMEAEVDGGPSLLSMSGHGIQSLRRDDVVEDGVAEIRGPEQFQRGTREDTV